MERKMKFRDIILTGLVLTYIKDKFSKKKEETIEGNKEANPNFSCPPSTQNIELNTRNRQIAIDKFLYSPPNPQLPSIQSWSRLAEVWGYKNPTAEQLKEIKSMLCDNCVAFDVSPQMKECLPPNPDSYDKEGLSSDSAFGYCWMHNFKCRNDRTCKTWAGGGAITSNDASTIWYQKAFSK